MYLDNQIVRRFMNNKYIRPRIKPIYPVYKLNDLLFRVGAQLGLTTEFEDDRSPTICGRNQSPVDRLVFRHRQYLTLWMA